VVIKDCSEVHGSTIEDHCPKVKINYFKNEKTNIYSVLGRHDTAHTGYREYGDP